MSCRSGCANAQSTFERLVERVQACVVYLDDLLVHASTFSEALFHLCWVLQRIQATGL